MDDARHDRMTTRQGGGAPRRPLFAREPGWQFSLMLGLECLFLFVAIPFLGGGDKERDLVEFLQFCLAVSSAALVAKNPWLRATLCGMFIVILLARWVPGIAPRYLTLCAVLLYNLLVTAVMIKSVLGPGEVNHHRIAGAIFIYLNIALVFTIAYALLRELDPLALSGVPPGMTHLGSHLTHFSFGTLTSIGNPEIAAHSPCARTLTDLETIIGQLFPAILLSRLVGLHLKRQG